MLLVKNWKMYLEAVSEQKVNNCVMVMQQGYEMPEVSFRPLFVSGRATSP